MEALELIDIICPEHGRTSCSDDNINNGFYFEDEESNVISKKYLPRCSRCALLEIAKGLAIDEDKVLYGLSLHFK